MTTIDAVAAIPVSISEMGYDATVEDIMKKIKELSDELQELKDCMKKKDDIIERLMKNDKKNYESDTGQMQPLKSKDIPKPDKYDLSPTEFLEWHELFVANMVGHDRKWHTILKAFRETKKVLKATEAESMLMDLGLAEDEIQVANQQLYITLLSFTKGSLLAKVKANQAALAMESYRYIHQRGNNATTMNVVQVTTAVMRPTVAKTISEVEARINDWKVHIKYLSDIGKFTLDHEQQKSILVSILPESLKEYMLQQYDTAKLYEDFEAKLTDHMALMEQQEKTKTKTVGAVAAEEQQHKEETEKECYYMDEAGRWICMAVPKRRRMEEDEEGGNGKGGKAVQGAGLVKGPRYGGCFNCGGDHFARECPHPPNKGKGKGKNPWVTQTAWNGWYPFRGWTKGKGKGDEKGGKGKGKVKGFQGKGPGKGKGPQYGGCYTCGGPHFSRDCPRVAASNGAVKCLSSVQEVTGNSKEEEK